MFTQFFGNYLLNKRLVTSEQLSDALTAVKTTRVKLGVLAINAGYMTAEQVEKILDCQRREDKRVGELAVDMGYMTGEQVERLFAKQTPTHLVLGQVLVDNGCMTNSEFEDALNGYKEKNSLTDSDFDDSENEKIHSVLRSFYEFDDGYDEVMIDYIDLLFKNIVRFIGDDFTPLDCEFIDEYFFANAGVQRVKGHFSCTASVEGDDKAYAGFASRYAGEEISAVDELADASAGEFLNLHNGLFAVNVSNNEGVELTLEPQENLHNKTLAKLSDTFVIPIIFPFGKISFVIGTF